MLIRPEFETNDAEQELSSGHRPIRLPSPAQRAGFTVQFRHQGQRSAHLPAAPEQIAGPLALMIHYSLGSQPDGLG